MNDHMVLLKKCKVSWIYPIYVPSYNRAGSAPLLEILAKASRSVQKRVHVVVRDSERAAYRRAYPWATICAHGGPYGVGTARAAALREASFRGHRRIMMIDDDVSHLNLMEMITREDGTPHTRRYSNVKSGMPIHDHIPRSMAVVCHMADQVFDMMPDAAYGSCRQGLFSNVVDTSIGAILDKGGFPACTLFFDLDRFTWRKCPEPYRLHGEDLSMFLHTLSEGKQAFIMPGVAYDTKVGIETTIPLDPLDERGRQDDLDAAQRLYPSVAKYLRPTLKNKLGGVMKIGVAWPQWYKDTGNQPVVITMKELLQGERDADRI